MYSLIKAIENCESIATVWIKQSDWLKIRSGHGILIYSAGQGLRGLDTLGRFAAILYKGDNICDFMFALHLKRSLI